MTDEIQRQLEADEALPKDAEVGDVVRCAGICDRDIHKGATADVVVGASIGEYEDPKPHVGVTGIDGGMPEHQQWCAGCVEEEFGIEFTSNNERLQSVTQYVTAKTVSAFALGVVLTYLVSSLLIV